MWHTLLRRGASCFLHSLILPARKTTCSFDRCAKCFGVGYPRFKAEWYLFVYHLSTATFPEKIPS